MKKYHTSRESKKNHEKECMNNLRNLNQPQKKVSRTMTMTDGLERKKRRKKKKGKIARRTRNVSVNSY